MWTIPQRFGRLPVVSRWRHTARAFCEILPARAPPCENIHVAVALLKPQGDHSRSRNDDHRRHAAARSPVSFSPRIVSPNVSFAPELNTGSFSPVIGRSVRHLLRVRRTNYGKEIKNFAAYSEMPYEYSREYCMGKILAQRAVDLNPIKTDKYEF